MRDRGFTLLELLIVLALIGLTAAIVVPGLGRTYDAVAASGERADVIRALEALPLRARASGREMLVPAGDEQALAAVAVFPEGWFVRLLDPLRIERSGLCHPARLDVRRGGVVETWTIDAPACGVMDAP